MRWDIENQLCRAQAFSGTGATLSAYSFEKQTAVQDLSIGRRMALSVLPVVAAGTGSSHYMECIQADDDALTSNVETIASVTVLAANLQKGDEIEIPIPQGVMTKKYVGFRNTISSGTTTVTLDVYLVPQDEIPKYKSFPKVVNAAV